MKMKAGTTDRIGDPQRKRTRHGFLDIRARPKLFFDLSLTTILDQVSVFNDLKEKRTNVFLGKKSNNS